MRTKIFSLLLALVLCIGVFALPMTAYAAPAENSTEATEPAAQPEATEPTVQPEASEPTEDDESGGESSIMDELFAAMLQGAFTPDGTGSILDYDVNYDEDKQFYTITTAAGNIFYLIIDGKREDNNVYFLNAVTEQDLMALAEKAETGTVSGIPSAATCGCETKCVEGAVNTECSVCKSDMSKCAGTAAQAEPEEPGEKQDMAGTIGMIVFIVIGVAAVAGVGYYVKIVRPKKQAADEDEFETEDYGEGFDPDAEFAEPGYLEEGSEDADLSDDDEEE